MSLSRDFNATWTDTYCSKDGVWYIVRECVRLSDTSNPTGSWEGFCFSVITLQGDSVPGHFTVGEDGLTMGFIPSGAYQKGYNVVYASRAPCKQWRKGARSSNSTLFHSNEAQISPCYMDSALGESILAGLQTVPYRVALSSVRKHRTEISVESHVITPELWFRRNEKKVELYYRNRAVGKVLSGKVSLFKSASYLAPRFKEILGKENVQ